MPASSRLALYLDMQILQSPVYRERGTFRYCLELARALSALPGAVRGMGLNPLMPFPAQLPSDLVSTRLQWSTAVNFRRALEEGPTAYMVMAPFWMTMFEALVPPYAARPDIPMVMMLTDVIPLTQPDGFFAEPQVLRRSRLRADLIRSADLVLTISEATRQEAIRVLELDEERTVNISSGVSPLFQPAEDRTQLRPLIAKNLPEITRPFVLCITGPWPRKNTEGLIQAFAELPEDLRKLYQLVLVCRLNDEYRARWRERAQNLGLSDDEVVLTDVVTESVLRTLYQSADLFVYPPFFEGFGLPAAEAAACGCPTIVSNTSSMPEILGFPPATFDPHDPADIARVMIRALTDSGFRQELEQSAAAAAQKHTWNAVARRAIDSLDRIERPIRQSWVPRVALVGGVPQFATKPQEFRMLDLAALSEKCELDVFGVERSELPASSSQHARYLPLEALGRSFNPAAYDAIVYVLGDSKPAEALALVYPSFIWLQPFIEPHKPPAPSGLHVRISRGVMVGSRDQLHKVRMAPGPGVRPTPVTSVADPAGLLEFVARVA
jgi:glycosyltransferase involved in cell wall biosynthesis